MAIQWASSEGHLEVVKYLVSVGCDPKAEDNASIKSASLKGRLETVKYLLSVGCDPKAEHNCAIRWASRYGSLKVIKYLLEQGCDHEDVDKKLKYEALHDVKHRLLTFMNPVPNKYLNMEILKRILPCFNGHQIISVLK